MSEVGRNQRTGCADKYSNEAYANAKEQIVTASMGFYGTGMGLDFDLLKVVKKTKKPIILLGGCGNADHIEKGLDEEKINAVATANLFNFIADGLEKSRAQLLSKNYLLPKWTS